VQTICQRLRQASFDSEPSHIVGGSTYSFDVWSGHPLEQEVKRQLGELRERLGQLRQQVDAHNRSHQPGPERPRQQVITYVGQCVLDRDLESEDALERT